MAKAYKAMWLGDADPSAVSIDIGGITFTKGEVVNVPDDIAVNGVPFADIIRDNPAFAIDDTKAKPVAAVEPADDA